MSERVMDIRSHPEGDVLVASGVRKRFDTAEGVLEILRGVEISLGRGEIVAVVGTSGVGKSTLLHILGGLERPTDGRVEIDGTDIFSLGERERARFRNSRIGFVFQLHHLLREFSALENVMLPVLLSGESARRATARAEELLEAFGLADRRFHRPGQLSGGEAQRVAVARALARDPAVVLADEPSGNLDPDHSEELYDLILRVREERGRSFLVATHDRELARKADRVVEIRSGLAWPLQEIRDERVNPAVT
jgi:lipoprotein-releasing system ATP-binding protein